MVFPDYSKVGDDENLEKFEKLWDAKLDPEPGLTVVEIVDAIHDDTIKGMYIMGENPAMSDRTPTMPAMHWPSSNTWWCRTSS